MLLTIALAFVVHLPLATAEVSSELHDDADRRLRNRYFAEEIVSLLYAGALMREPDPQGLRAWTNIVVRRGYRGLLEVARGIGSSEEFADNVYYYGADEVLRSIYGVFFLRDVDPAGARYWTPMLWDGRGGDALQGIVGSDEFYYTNLVTRP